MQEIRNVAIIAHVDHGKTTLVDALFKTAGTFRSNQKVAECAMDSNSIERERGITILAKNTSVMWRGVRINIVDTPGHADFGGEVERTLLMADGVLLLVDSFEGPMPQTRFVLQKAFQNKLKPIVVVNKMDRPDRRPGEVLNEVFDLFVALEADDQALDFPVVYASGREGKAGLTPDNLSDDLVPLMDAILQHIPAPKDDPKGPTLFQVATLDYDEFVGRIGIGRVRSGYLRVGDKLMHRRQDGRQSNATVRQLFTFEDLKRVPTNEVQAGGIAAISGFDDINIGDGLGDPTTTWSLPPILIDEPTISMIFGVNDGPLAGREGKYVTSRQIQGRIDKAALADAALRVEQTEKSDQYRVSGRGLLHLGILIENMRREGFEFVVGKPRVILKEIDGVRCEPIETAIVETPDFAVGRVIEFLGRRRGEMVEMRTKGSMQELEFKIPSRGLIGARTALLSLSQGEAILHHVFRSYEPDRGSFSRRQNGVLVASEPGQVTTYALEGLADRGTFFIQPGDPVYTGMITGENCKDGDLVVNVCRLKKLTNVRSATKEATVRLAAARLMGVEEALEYIEDDEMVEITPSSVRLRKRLLDEKARKRERDQVEAAR
ncbi:MAG: translational GTPase TypA [Planctomycetes bacterium]|nr:translational GTPase TypA [Planctomycetota bacterium]